jgi:hypothetical protein
MARKSSSTMDMSMGSPIGVTTQERIESVVTLRLPVTSIFDTTHAVDCADAEESPVKTISASAAAGQSFTPFV